jgi:hypothetical protein
MANIRSGSLDAVASCFRSAAVPEGFWAHNYLRGMYRDLRISRVSGLSRALRPFPDVTQTARAVCLLVGWT